MWAPVSTWSKVSRQRYSGAAKHSQWALPLLDRDLAMTGSRPTDVGQLSRALSFAIGVGEHETSMGLGWGKYPSMVSSLNLGSQHAGLPPCRAGEALAEDRRQDGVVYAVCFKTYPDWPAAARGLMSAVYGERRAVWRDVNAGLLAGGVLAMYRATYFGGTRGRGNTVGNVSQYLGAMFPAVIAAGDVLWGGSAAHEVLWADFRIAYQVFLEEDRAYVEH